MRSIIGSIAPIGGPLHFPALAIHHSFKRILQRIPL
jgi:hypothetical protein